MSRKGEKTMTHYIIATPKTMIGVAGMEARAFGRRNVTDELGWVPTEYAHTFTDRDEAVNLLVSMGYGIGAEVWVRPV
jgi:hypothetical protein